MDKDKNWVRGPQVSKARVIDPFYVLTDNKESLVDEAVLSTRVQYWLDQASGMPAVYATETITNESPTDDISTSPMSHSSLQVSKMSSKDLSDADVALPKVIRCYNRLYYWINTGRPADEQIPYEIAQIDLASVTSILSNHIVNGNDDSPLFLTEYMQKNLNRIWKKYAHKDGKRLDKEVSSVKTIDGKYAI
tara:strand:- start:3053 stop:3628 length:576 start_codon:yes stop_codon:yes gene_type:complete